MNDLLFFDYQDSTLRIVMLGDDPWFVAADVAAILGYDHTPSMVRLLDDDEAAVRKVHSSGQLREMTIISESGFYNACFSSNKAEAKALKRFVTGTLLPTLRRTGTYTIPSVDDAPGAEPVTDLGRYRLDLDAVALYRRLAGNGAALALWAHLGLPVPPSPGTGPAIADGLVEALASWIAGPPARDRFTYADIAHGLGIGTPDHLTKRRIHDVLAAQGWIYKNMKFGPVQRWAWKAPDPGPVTEPVTADAGDAA